MTAKFYAARGFRRRSYDDQEGDNDINIILQPSDLDDIENEARVKYANYLTAAATTFGRIHYKATNQERASDPSTNKQTQTASHRTGALKTPRLTTICNIFNDMKLAKCLLDQDYNQTVRLFIEKSALNWNFNSFTFDALCCGRSLTELLMHLFDYYNLYTIFNLDIVKVLKCFRLLEFGYHSTNPYHNSVHAADVTQAMHCFIQENKIKKHMTNLEILCSILAAVCHDLDHPGVNQSFLVATNNPLAGLYQNNSVLENHHWRFALCIFKEARLFDHFPQDVLDDMKEQLKHLILATDIARQNDYLKRFRDLTSSRNFSMQNTDDRALVLQMALKCADLGNPCRPWLISRVWSNLICDEFYRMGQIERRLGVPLTPICQREKTSIAGIQADFFRFIVLPLLELWHKFLESPLSNLLMSNFDHNYKRWQRANRIVQQLRRRKSVACLEPVPYDCVIDFNDYDKDDNQQSQDDCGHNRDPSTDLEEALAFPEGHRQDRDSSVQLIIDPESKSYYSRRPFNAIKRASSDYIKSGNGKLELLRDFQLDRIIERSPLIIRRKTVKLIHRKNRTEEKTTKTSHQDSNEPVLGSNETSDVHKTLIQKSNNATNNNCKLQDLPIAKATATITKSTIINEPQHTTIAELTTSAPVSLNQRQQQSNLSASCELVARQAPGIDHNQTSRWAQSSTSSASSSTTAAAAAAIALSSCSDGRQQLQTICGNYRKVLSPIEDGGEGPSPELRATSQNDDGDDGQLAKTGGPSGHCGGDLNVFKQKQQPKATTSPFPTATSPDTDRSSATSSSVSRSISRASSACSSPVMQRSFSSRTSIDQSLSKHIKQQHQRQQQQKQRTTQIQNHPFLAQYYETSSGARIKQSNLSSTRQSVSHSKTMYNNRRRESDPGCLTDNYELAAAIVLIQYQSNSLFHKRRSSLPVCMPRRRSSK